MDVEEHTTVSVASEVRGEKKKQGETQTHGRSDQSCAHDLFEARLKDPVDSLGRWSVQVREKGVSERCEGGKN